MHTHTHINKSLLIYIMLLCVSQKPSFRVCRLQLYYPDPDVKCVIEAFFSPETPFHPVYSQQSLLSWSLSFILD